MNNEQANSSGSAPRGEVFVWLSAMGLTVGLLMVGFLFLLIGYNGVVVFWPRNVVEIELLSERNEVSVIAGVPESARKRSVFSPAEERTYEYYEERIFTGNRDAYGQSFTYFRSDEVVSRRYPKDIMVAERREWGDAIFYPAALRLSDGTVITRDDPVFFKTLSELIGEGKRLRREINRLERHEIGNINFRMRNIDLELRYLRQQGDLLQREKIGVSELEAERAELLKRYQVLEQRAGRLRELLSATTLTYTLPQGREGSIATGHIFSYYFPNKLSLGEKFMVFYSHIKDFLTGFPREANTEGGIYPAIFGTLVMTLIMSIAVTPFGVIAAVYLREYARQGLLVRAVRVSVNNLAGVPSIVFGVFGLGFFVYLVGGSVDQLFYSSSLPSPTFGTGGILWAGLTLALLNLPVVIVATEEALAAVSRGVREGGLACGASKWQTIQNLVLPASLPGILTGLVLAMARGAGEVAPLMLVGVVALAPNLPIDGNFPFIHLERSFMHLGFHIFDVGFQSPDSEAAIPMVFATTLVLISLIVVLNLSAILLRNHIRKKYQASAF